MLVLFWVGALTLFGIDWAASGWSDPQPQFRFWTYLAGPLLLLTAFGLRHEANLRQWLVTTATAVGWGVLLLMTKCTPAVPTHQCYQTTAQGWFTPPVLLLFYVGFPLAVTIAAVATIRALPRRSGPRPPEATA